MDFNALMRIVSIEDSTLRTIIQTMVDELENLRGRIEYLEEKNRGDQ